MGLVNDTVSAVVKPLARWVGKDRNKTYDDVEAALLRHHPHADKEYLREAYEFAHKAHEGQTRKTGEPYIIHPIFVAFILAESKLDIETVASGFLHDVVEDCNVEVSDLEEKFGKNVGCIVDGVTKIGKVKFRDKEQAQAENYRKMIMAMSNDIRVLIVKLADRCHNMNTLASLRDEKRRRISQETLDIYCPLAHRIGMSHLKAELERWCFFYLEPEAYKELSQELAEREKRQGKFLNGVKKVVGKLLDENHIKAEVSSRVKSKFSIYRKMKRKGCSLDALYDYYAFRIITESVEDCYKTFGLLHSKWQHIPGRIKDFIATPKANLYQSIHTTLMSPDGQSFEVQVRTRMMHRIAEEGVAAHWSYKDGRLMNVGKNEFESWLKKMAEDQKDVEDTDEFLEGIKGHLGAREILVFTPNSEIKTLPAGATPLDFAYLIHTEVGHKAVGAKVDGKMVSLRSELQSGSIVEIITKNSQRPNEEWLQWVQTPSARTKVRAWLRKEERDKAVEVGRNKFEKALKKNKIPVKSVKNTDIVARLPVFEKRKIEDFYAAIGFGSITTKNAVKPFLPEDPEAEANRQEALEERRNRAIEKVTKKSKNMLQVKGHNDILVRLAKCCNPISGDQIVGYITLGHGISVHKKGCRSFAEQNVNPARKVEVTWDVGAETSVFMVKLKVFTEDRAGMIADISQVFTDTKTTVQNLNAQVNEDKGVGIFDITLQIHTLDHLTKVIQNMKRVKGVLSCERFQ